MVKTYLSPDHKNVVCPSCGAEIKAPSSLRSRRVQCPKCREVVTIEAPPESVPPAKKERAPAPPESAQERSHPETLEGRVAALEAAVAALLVAGSTGERGGEKKKLIWATADAADPLHAFVPEREFALAHNLGTVQPREIVIRAPAGDLIAAERAACFRAVFERAGWIVRGPEYAAPETVGTALALGVPALPVGKEAAETYLALKAAGFEPVPVLDSALITSTGTIPLSLTLPSNTGAETIRENRTPPDGAHPGFD